MRCAAVLLRCALVALVAFAGVAVQAHEILPASLVVEQIGAQVFDVRWRIPATQGPAPDLRARLPADCVPLAAPVEQDQALTHIVHWQARCSSGLAAGSQIVIEGLESTLLDAVVRVGWRNGRSVSLIAQPRQRRVTLPDAGPAGTGVAGYFGLGVEHILGGIDHLLFVLCLILLVRGLGPLLRTITAFTLAHSTTLALAALGFVQVPQAPVEATIALSILLLACELARPGSGAGMAARRPWAVAFVFGLLHGFGFAGALAEVGLPAGEVPLALLLFNLGVETGQLLFVAAVLVLPAVMQQARRMRALPTLAAPVLRDVPVHAVGAVAAFWWLQRMSAVLGL